MDSAESSTPKVGKRHRRMPINSAVLMLRGDESWTSELMDISATGVLVRRPFDWIGQKGDRFVLDMLFGDELNIHVEARVARVADDEVGFAFSRIPPDKEAPLWNLLGGYADSHEVWTD
ncbi:MAG: PilZ domain-containing protein [Lysobacterales bacterium]